MKGRSSSVAITAAHSAASASASPATLPEGVGVRAALPHRLGTPPPRAADPPRSAPTGNGGPPPLLQAKEVSIGYRGHEVVHAVDAAFEGGTVVGLIGPNGAGKSTLLRALAGLQHVSTGSVLTPQGDLSRLSSRERARLIAFLPQTTTVDAGLTVEAVVGLGRYAHHGALTRIRGDLTASDRAMVESALARVGADHLAERRIDRLSGGQRQIVLLAKQLAQESHVLLLDEPVSALDLAYQLDVLDLIRSLAAEGRAIGVVLHDLDLAARACDRLLLLSSGHLLAAGAPSDVLTPELLEATYAVRATVRTDPATGRPSVTALGRARPPRP